MKCLNCNTEYEGNFCPNCGQKSTTKKLTFFTLFNHILYGFTTVDRGIFHNIYYLTINPNKVVNHYLDGKRKNIFNPISYAIIMISIYLLVEGLVKNPVTLDSDGLEGGLFSFGYEIGKFIRINLKYFWLLNIVTFSLISRIFFDQRNLVEHLTIHSFVLGHSSLFAALSYPILKEPIIFNPVVFVVMAIMIFVVYKKYYHVLLVALITLVIIVLGMFLFLLLPTLYLVVR